MGEVYRAIDTRLDRTVAVKVLPSHLSSDPDKRQRLDREARAVSSLSHPHICALFDIGHEQQTDFLVMEYLEGKTLEQLLEKGPLPADQVLRYGIEIADALDKAHRKGIIHRDLKPGNIMITSAGAKVLDFGLAKLAASEPFESEAETKSRSLTMDGAVLGTLPYMAPEQLEGRALDARADVFAFGAVLYEMASGGRPFTATQRAGLIAAILTTDPPSLPGALGRVAGKCLAKDPEDRWQTMRDVTLELKWIREAKALPASPAAKRPRLAWIPWVLASAMFLTALVLFVRSNRGNNPVQATPQQIRFTVNPPQDSTFDGSIAISPDGNTLAFVATSHSGISSLWIRALDSVDSQILAGTQGASEPFWSPDSKFLGFFADGHIKKIAIPGGSAQAICEAQDPRGGTWNGEGVILFAANAGGGLYRVSQAGGNVTQVTTLNEQRNEGSHRYPTFLPDGRHFLFFVLGMNAENTGIGLGSLDSKETTWLLPADSSGVYGAQGNLFYVRNQSLMGVAFDAKLLKTIGDPYLVANQVWTMGYVPALTAISAASNNVIAYRSGGILKTHLLFFDRSGKQVRPEGPAGMCHEPALSPDEKKLSLSCMDPQTALGHVWLMDLTRGTMTRFTSSSSFEANSTWSQDAKSVYYSSYPEGGLYRQGVETADRELLLKPETFSITDDATRDGRYLVYTSLDFKSNRTHLWILPLFGNRKPVPYLQTTFNEMNARVSPDGRWLAYSSDESGREEVYVQSFPAAANKAQISNDGGAQPAWRGDGKELYYVAPDKKVMSVDIKEGALLEPGVPRVLFQTEIAKAMEARNQYEVTSDGRLFMVNTPVREIAAAPIIVFANWTAGKPSR